MEHYQAIMDAVAIISKARLAEYEAHQDSPAWVKLVNAGNYLKEQAMAEIEE